MPLVGTTIIHTLDFVKETEDGTAIYITEQQVIRLSMNPRSCTFVFDWNILLDARQRPPKRLVDLLKQIKELGFQVVAIRTNDAPDVPVSHFHRIYVQQESQETEAFFRNCYRRIGESNIIFFGADQLLFAVLNQRQEEKDVFISVEPNQDTADGTPSYLEEILAMVLVVQAGKKITSHLTIND
jgi:hypothetical protein